MRVRGGILVMAGLGLLGVLAAGAACAAAEDQVTAPAEQRVEETLETDDDGPKTIYDVWETVALAISVSFVTAVSIVGAGFAVGKVGSAAIGAAAEKPELLTRSLLFVALAEGLAVLGFAVAMMLLAKM